MTVSIKESTNMNALLLRLPLEMRHKAVPQALRAGLKPTAKRAKQLAPRGELRHQPDKPPLYTTIKVVIRKYGETVLGIVGAKWPEGAHAHLVEFGHRQVVWGHQTNAVVPGKAFMAPAIDQTQSMTNRAVITKLVSVIKKAGG